MDIYAPQSPIIERLEQRLKTRFRLREIYSDSSLADLAEDAVQAPALAVVPGSFQIIDVDADSGDTLLETRWLVVPIVRPANDRGRGTRARDAAGELVVEMIRALSAWKPADGFNPLLLRRVYPPRHLKSKVFIPIEFGSVTTIDPYG